jgi:NitT/TauT family transport system permease protein
MSALRHHGTTVLVLIAFVALLQVMLTGFHVPSWIMPTPVQIWDSFLENRASVWFNLRQTGYGAMAGLLIGGGIAIFLAMAMVYAPLLERILMPILLIEQSIPKVALAPMFVIWFGTGMTSRIVIAMVISFFPILINTYRGLTAVDPRLGSLMHVLSGNDLQMFAKIRLPNAVPYIFSGFRVAIPAAIIGAVVAEFVQSDSGLGFLILVAHGRVDMPFVIVCVVVLAGMSLLLYGISTGIERFVMNRRFRYLGAQD